MTAAIISLFGLFVGASLQFLFTKHLENRKHQRELRARAYTDFLQCVSEHSHLGYQKNTEAGRKLWARTTDAKCRISLYGDADVIEKFAEFERLGPVLISNEPREAFTDMVLSMRQDTLGASKVVKTDLKAVLLGVER